jgi:repressor LexA
MLTPRQAELLRFVAQYQDAHGGASPSREEMKAALGVGSKSNIARVRLGREKRGFLRAVPFRARAIEILRQPDSVFLHHICPLCGQQIPQREVKAA